MILGLLVVVTSGCSTLNQWSSTVKDAFSVESSAETQTAPAPALNSWSVIDGGVLDGAVESNSLVTGATGLEYTRLQRPVAIAVRGQWLYIVDAGLNKLFRYDLALHRMRILKDLRDIVSGDVDDIYVTSDFHYYLADTQGARVLHFDANGALVETLQDSLNIRRPVGVYVDESRDRVFVADGFRDDVLIFNQARQIFAVMGERGDMPGEFRRITAFAASAKGYYIATRFGSHRVWRMALDGHYAEALQQDTVTFPTALTADDSGRVFVGDYLDNTIRIYEGTKMVKIVGHNGSAPGQFRRIADLWLNGDVLYVADSLNGRIQFVNVPDLDIPAQP